MTYDVNPIFDAIIKELTNTILQEVKAEFEQLKKDYQPKEPVIYIPRAELAKELEVDLSTIHNWTKKKKLKAYGISGRVYYKRHEVEESMIRLNPENNSESEKLKGKDK